MYKNHSNMVDETNKFEPAVFKKVHIVSDEQIKSVKALIDLTSDAAKEYTAAGRLSLAQRTIGYKDGLSEALQLLGLGDGA